ncbi:hypothetical protein [Bradyrhizobium japonicum]|uniref:hypothetical protein n=1 Tax=Bradyrhizobium japonicum TaxID=375 RepID=UPI00201343E1|nr:hypothetical protein [Bradyrhizobium japonicum]
MALPSSPLKNSHGPSLIGGGGFPAFGAQGNLPAIVAALTVVALNSSKAVPARNSLRRRPIIVSVPCFIFSSASVHRAGTSMSFGEVKRLHVAHDLHLSVMIDNNCP